MTPINEEAPSVTNTTTLSSSFSAASNIMPTTILTINPLSEEVPTAAKCMSRIQEKNCSQYFNSKFLHILLVICNRYY